MKRASRAGIGIAAAVLVGLLYWALRPAAVEVELARVERGAFVQTVDELAKTRIRDHFTVTAPLNGELSRIALREGDDVPAGAVLAQLRPALPALLDSRTELELRRRVEAAQAARQAADARVGVAIVAQSQASAEAARSRKLLDSGLIAPAKAESDELTLAMAGKELESAQAGAHLAAHDIDIARAALARARRVEPDGKGAEWPLLAPIGGRVLRVQQRSAGAVSLGMPLLELGDPANLEVLIELLTNEAPLVVPGARVQLMNWGGSGPLAGRVRRVEPWGFTKISALGVEEQRVNVLVDITTPRAEWSTLGEGYRLDAAIEIYRRPNALIVPTGALFRVGESWYVYRATSASRAQRVAVRIGHRNDLQAEVLAGLTEGDAVIVYPGDRVRDGVRVTAQIDQFRRNE